MNLKKIIILLILMIPNIVNADFFEDITYKIVDNPKRLSYGVSVADIDQNGKYEFIVTGFGYPNLALTHDNGKLINIACLLYTSPSPRDVEESRMPSSA